MLHIHQITRTHSNIYQNTFTRACSPEHIHHDDGHYGLHSTSVCEYVLCVHVCVRAFFPLSVRNTVSMFTRRKRVHSHAHRRSSLPLISTASSGPPPSDHWRCHESHDNRTQLSVLCILMKGTIVITITTPTIIYAAFIPQDCSVLNQPYFICFSSGTVFPGVLVGFSSGFQLKIHSSSDFCFSMEQSQY